MSFLDYGLDALTTKIDWFTMLETKMLQFMSYLQKDIMTINNYQPKQKTPHFEAFSVWVDFMCFILPQPLLHLIQFRKRIIDDGKSRPTKSGMSRYGQYLELALTVPK